MKALLVDDNPQIRQLLKYIFEQHQWESAEAADGLEGLEMAATQRPDLIVSDALMPRMDGFQFLRSIKNDPELKQIPFVFYSSVFTGGDDQTLALSLGAAKFIEQPKDSAAFWDELLPVIEKKVLKEQAVKELLEQDEPFLRRYGHIVASKLEEKVKELESEIALRRQAEESLKESEENYRLLAETSQDFILVLDLEGTIIYANSSVMNSNGWTQKDIGKRNIMEIIAEEYRDAAKERINKRAKGNRQVFRYESAFLNHRGEKIPVDVSTSPIIKRDETVSILVTAHDLSERKKAEAALREQMAITVKYQAEREKMQAMKDLSLTYALSIFNAITPVQGFAELILKKLDPSHQEYAWCQKIISATHEIKRMVEKLQKVESEDIDRLKGVDHL